MEMKAGTLLHSYLQRQLKFKTRVIKNLYLDVLERLSVVVLMQDQTKGRESERLKIYSL